MFRRLGEQHQGRPAPKAIAHGWIEEQILETGGDHRIVQIELTDDRRERVGRRRAERLDLGFEPGRLGATLRLQRVDRAPPLGEDGDPADQRREHDRGDQRRDRRVAPGAQEEPPDHTDRPGDDRLALEPGFEVGGDLGRTAVPPTDRLLQALVADRLQISGKGAVEDPKRDRIVFLHQAQRRHGRRGHERGSPGEHRVQHGAESVDVGPRSDPRHVPDRLFRGHVAGRTDRLSRPGQLVVALDPPDQPEIGDPGVALFVDQDVPRLEVAVEHALFVRVLDRPGRLAEELGGFPGIQRPVRDPLPERGSTDEVEREVVASLKRADLVHGDDRGVPQTSRRPRLDQESLDLFLGCEPPGEDHLHRDDAIQRELTRPVDHSHRAAPDLLLQLVVAEGPGKGRLVVEKLGTRPCRLLVVGRVVHPRVSLFTGDRAS